MSDQVIETIYGKYNKYEILKSVGPLGGIKFYLYRDGKPFKGSYSSLADAVEAAKKEG